MGRLFQSLGAATKKARLPYQVKVQGPGANWRWDCLEDLKLYVQESWVGRGEFCWSHLFIFLFFTLI